MRTPSMLPRVAGRACLALLLGALPASAGSLSVTAASANVGAYGLAVEVGDTCTSPDHLVLSSPPAPVQGDYEGCLTIDADNLEVTGSGAVFRAGETVRLGNGFSVASGADFTAAVEPSLASAFASVEDPSPIAERAYHATFFVRLDALTLSDGDAIEHLVAYSGSGQSAFVLTLRKNPSSQDSLHLAARVDGGGLVQMIPGQELPLSSGWNKIEIDWTADGGSGAFLVALNDGAFSGLTGLANGLMNVESVRWGAIGGSVSTSAGTIEIDGFDSWR